MYFQDSHAGLEFEDRENGGFMSATPREGMLYLGIGDMFLRLSNGKFHSPPTKIHASATI